MKKISLALLLLIVSACSKSQDIKYKREISWEYDINYESGKKYKELCNKVIINYNHQGNKIERSTYRGNGKLLWTHKYRYNSSGSLIEEARYLPDGSINP